MPYIGNTIRAADDYRLIDDISSGFNGSETSFALQVAGAAPVPFPKSPQQVLISVNGVIQEPDPTGSSGFNLVGTNIVFSSAPTNGHAFFGIIYATADYLNAGGNFPAGSLGAPSLTFIGDENTGIYRKGSGSIGFVSDATEIANTDSNGLTISSGNLILGDSSGANDDRIKLGASGDLEIYHDGTHSYIQDSGTGELRLRGTTIRLTDHNGTENFANFVDNGAVELFFDNAKKAETVTGGFTVTGVCTATSFAGDGSSLSGINTDLVSDTSPQLGGNLASNGNNIDVADSTGSGNNRIKFGTSADLSIYHNGNHSFIEESGTGALKVLSSNIQLLNAAGNETMIQGTQNGAVELYYDNSKKFETFASGVRWFGQLICPTAGDTLQFTGANSNAFLLGMTSGADSPTGSDEHLQFHHWNGSAWEKTFFVQRHNITIPDSNKVQWGDSADLQIYHDGSNSFIQDSGTGTLKILANQTQIINAGNSENIANFTQDGAVELYYDNAKKIETINQGIKVTGDYITESNSTGFKTDSSGHMLFIQGGASLPGGRIEVRGGTSDADIRFGSGSASSFTERCRLDSSGHFRPATNNTFDLGTSSLRWRNVFTNDLNLSNEGSSNDVDSTWGDYTIQEGFEDLFLINNRTGKKFKFNLTEVS